MLLLLRDRSMAPEKYGAAATSGSETWAWVLSREAGFVGCEGHYETRVPLVLGTMLARRVSISMAMRSERARHLKIASLTWCVLRP